MAAAAILENTKKRRISANSGPICNKFGTLVDDDDEWICRARPQIWTMQVSLGVQNGTFCKFKNVASAILESTQKGISWPIFDQFAPNLICSFDAWVGTVRWLESVARWRRHM